MATDSSQPDPAPRTLGEIDLFKDAPAEVIEDIKARCHWVDCKENDVIMDLNDTSNNVFFLRKGKLRATVFLTEDIEVSLADLMPGDTFGELSAVDLKMRSARVTALEPSKLAELSREDFQYFLLECPVIALALLKRFAGLIRALNTRVTVVSTMTPHQRVYHELLRLAEPDPGEEGSWVVMNAPSHTELSTWISTDKQTVADAIGNLVRTGVLARRFKNLIIRDYKRLQRLTDVESALAKQ